MAPLVILEKTKFCPMSNIHWVLKWESKPGLLQSMGSQRVGYDWAAELTENEKFIWDSWEY